jgi:peptidoglycan/xylan/chitin deacetylase (PgdA/CDA1 family)
MLKKIIVTAIRFSGIPFLVRNIYAKRKVSIVVYHDPMPDMLDGHLNYLSRRYNFITLDCLVNAIHSRDWSEIPPNGLVVTIDDGRKGNVNLREVFKKYNVVPTIYLCTRVINTNRKFWFKQNGLDPESIKKYSNSKRLDSLNEKYGFTPTREYPEAERQALNLEEMELMKDFVGFQSHTLFHPLLPTVSSDEECWEEIFQSKKDIEDLFSRECRHFAYPNGNYGEREIRLLREAGYLSARNTDVGWNDLNTDPYRLKATIITDNASIDLLAAQLSGITTYIRYVLKGSINGRKPSIKPDI